MLRLIGLVILVLLIVGPLMLQAGLLGGNGLLYEFVELEVRAFTELVDWIRGLLAGRV